MRAPVFLLAVVLAGCQSLSGLTGATPHFACKAPDGIACSSVSGVYATVQARHGAPTPASRASATTALPATAPAPGEPLRSAPRVLRIWVAPWIDDDGALHDQAFLFVQVDPGQWRIGELRRQAAQSPTPAAPAPHAGIAARTLPSPAGQGELTVATSATRSPSNIPTRPLADVRHDTAAQAAARAVAEPPSPSKVRP